MRVGKRKVERATQAIRYIRQRPPHVRLKENGNPGEFMQTLIEDINEQREELMLPEERL